MAVRVSAYAKINLGLEILGKRVDGFHEVRTILQTISLFDNVVLEKGPRITLRNEIPGISFADNLVVKAAALLQRHAGISSGSRIMIDKRIPISGGLGGGSSDAAASLVGLNVLWKLGLTKEEMACLSASLGADVPFFIYGGTALAEGFGERIIPLDPMSTAWLVLLVPNISLSSKTTTLYSHITAEQYTRGEHIASLLENLGNGNSICNPSIFNVFESLAKRVFPGLSEYIHIFEEIAGTEVHLAGSGPTLFTLVQSEDQSFRICNSLIQRGLKAHVATTIPRA